MLLKGRAHEFASATEQFIRRYIFLMQPPNVKDVVKRISSTPFEDIGRALVGFRWAFDKVSSVASIRLVEVWLVH